MEYPRSPSLSWTYFYQGKNMEELRYSLFCTSLELETTRVAAQEEIKRREDQIIQLKDLLNRSLSERDEAEEKCQKHLMDKLILFQQLQQQQQHLLTPNSGGSSNIDEETRRGRGGDSNTGMSSSDCEESIVSSPGLDPIIMSPSIATAEKALPEKGKLLEAVMKAGPLLQTLLLAGPLPQWRHPPPSLDTFEIPPVAIPSPSPSTSPSPSPSTSPPQASLLHRLVVGKASPTSTTNVNKKKKRSLLVYEGSEDSSTTSSKYPRVHLH